MANLSVCVACGEYDRMEAIRTGVVQPEGLDLTYIAIQSPPEIFARMIKGRSFDVSEMSLSTYVSNRAKGDFPFIAIPVFPARFFRHGNIFVNRRRGVFTPKDLECKRIGTFGYRQTASCWIRGLLADDYGVDLSTVVWVEGGAETPWQGDSSKDPRNAIPGVRFARVPETASLSDMLASGEIDALIGARRPASLKTSHDVDFLFPNFREAERNYFLRTGIFPIMHTMVIREDLHRSHPWMAESLFKAFVDSKEWAKARMRFSGSMRFMLPWMFDEIDEIDELFGGDAYPYGLEENRIALEAFCRNARAQGLLDRDVRIDDLFVPIIGE